MVLQIGEDPEIAAAQPSLWTAPKIFEFAAVDGNSKYMMMIQQLVRCEAETLYFCGLHHTMSFICIMTVLF